MASGQGTTVLASPVVIPGYVPITGSGRVHWFVSNTLGPASLTASVFTSALSTRSNSPPEYGPHWEGFAKRNALRISGLATSSLIEGSLGSIWGEDPRYFRSSSQSVKRRLDHVLFMTVLARNRSGNLMPAYARYIAIPSSTFLTNAWRPDSQTQLRDAVDRMVFSMVSRVLGNMFAEFGPDLFKRLSKKKTTYASVTAEQCAATPQLVGCK